MKFSIITPSYNQANFLGKTIESVISQTGNFELEYIVMDGGSTDKSVEILKETEERLKNNPKIKFVWKSEKDNGQSDAINKGLRLASGDIMAFLNSDDVYLDGCLDKVSKAFKKNPQINWLTGYCRIIDQDGNQIQSAIMKYKNFFLDRYSYKKLLVLNFVSQPCTFWRKEILDSNGLFDEKLHYTMDYDYWLRIGKKHKPLILKEYLSGFRIHGESKGGAQYVQQFNQDLETCRKYTSSPILINMHAIHNLMIKFSYKIIK